MNLSELNIPESPFVTATNEIIAYLRKIVDGDGKIALPLVRRAKEAREGPPVAAQSPAVLLWIKDGQDKNEGVQMALTGMERQIQFYVYVFEQANRETIVQQKENLYLFIVNALREDKFIGLTKDQDAQFELGKHYHRSRWDFANPQAINVDFTDALSARGERITLEAPWDCFRIDIDIRADNKGTQI